MVDFIQNTNVKSAVRKLANPIADISAFNATAKRIGSSSDNYGTIAGYNAGIPAMLANSANSATPGGTPVRNEEADSFSVTLKCHDPNGELYNVNCSRQQVTVSSYEDDAIRIRIETWADGVPALA